MGTRRRPGAHRPSARLFAHDRALGVRRVAGADEAGRGCLAGPLVVAAVCLDIEGMAPRARRALGDLDDSKRLAPPVRERLAQAVMRHAEQVVVVLRRAGHHRPRRPPPHQPAAPGPGAGGHRPVPVGLPGGRVPRSARPRPRTGRWWAATARSACIAAASVVAKVTRDRLMARSDGRAHTPASASSATSATRPRTTTPRSRPRACRRFTAARSDRRRTRRDAARRVRQRPACTRDRRSTRGGAGPRSCGWAAT